MKDKLCQKLAQIAPKRFIYFCAIRLGAHATTGKYSNQEVPKLTFFEALERWEN